MRHHRTPRKARESGFDGYSLPPGKVREFSSDRQDLTPRKASQVVRLAVLLFLLVWLVLAVGQAHAGYALASPPPGWAPVVTPSGTERGLARAAANSPWSSGATTGSSVVNVGGRQVTVPAKLRVAANAGRYAGRFGWSPVGVAVAVSLPLLTNWYLQNGFQWDSNASTWKKQNTDPNGCYTAPCYGYRVTQVNTILPTIWPTPMQAAVDYGEWRKGRNDWGSYTVNSATSGNYNISFCFPNGGACGSEQQGMTQSSRSPDVAGWNPTTQAEMESTLDAVPVPDSVLNESGAPAWPVEDPLLNPSPAGVPQTLRAPLGSPQPVPNTSPQKYSQPVADVIPRKIGAVGDPWGVEIIPRLVESEDPEGVTTPETPPDPASDPNTTPKQDADLCEKHPDALACQRFGEVPEATAMTTKTVNVSMSEDAGWNLAPAVCPAPKVVNLGPTNQQFSFSLQLMCDFASGIKPVILGVAYLTATLLFFGLARRAD